MIDVVVTEFFKRILSEEAFLGDEGHLNIMDFNLDHVLENTEDSPMVFWEFVRAYCVDIFYDAFCGLHTFELNDDGLKVVEEFWPHR